jgi:hypothetical protein
MLQTCMLVIFWHIHVFSFFFFVVVIVEDSLIISLSCSLDLQGRERSIETTLGRKLLTADRHVHTIFSSLIQLC